MEALRLRRRDEVKNGILDAAKNGTLNEALIDDLILRNWPRAEKVVSKDIKIRTFIGQEKMAQRTGVACLRYLLRFGAADRQSGGGRRLDCARHHASTLNHPDPFAAQSKEDHHRLDGAADPLSRCYGIDMSELGKFVAFEAGGGTIEGTRPERPARGGLWAVPTRADQCGGQHGESCAPHLRAFTAAEISAKIAGLVFPKDIEWSGPVQIIYQTIENLHAAVPNHTGDWYFTGKYPTPGGYRVVNQAYVNYFEKNEGRSY